MKVIKPVAVTPAMLLSSTVAEPASGEAVYSAATTYAVGARVILASTHRAYKSLVAGNLGNPPDTSSLAWVDDGPTARYAMFDSETSTATTAPTVLTVSLAPGNINSLSLLGAVGSAATIEVLDAPGGTVVYARTVSLDGSIVTNWYEYFFEPITQRGEVVLTDLPSYDSCVVTVTIDGGGDVACADLVVGTVYELGDTLFGAKVRIIDRSVKLTDDFGTTTFVRRGFTSELSADFQLSNQQFAKVRQLLALLRATPCVWIGDEQAIFSPLIVFGFYKDFSITVAYALKSLCNLEIEGLSYAS